LIAANAAVLAILYILERGWGFKYESSRTVTYEKIELITPARRAEMLADLEDRTGLKIKRVSIGKVDFLRDVASLTVYYDDPQQESWLRSPAVEE
jgi:hypothetical protein